MNYKGFLAGTAHNRWFTRVGGVTAGLSVSKKRVFAANHIMTSV